MVESGKQNWKDSRKDENYSHTDESLAGIIFQIHN